jgi:hypothetical protein
MSAGFDDVTVATPDEVEAARLVVSNAMSLLDWCAGLDAMLLSDDGETVPVLPEDLREAYGDAVDELRAEHYELADTTFSGNNEQLGFEEVTRILGAVGWTGRLLQFKLGVLEHAGRREVMEVAGQGRGGGGRIRRRVFSGFLGVLNAALDSLSGIPGVGAIKELKDFLERAIAA